MSDNNFSSSIEKIFNGIKGTIDSKVVVGDAVSVKDATIIPLIEITYGMGIGDFEGKSAGGTGLKYTPIALCVIQNGITKVIQIKNSDPITKLIEIIPDLINDVLRKEKISNDIKEETKKIQKKYNQLNNKNNK